MATDTQELQLPTDVDTATAMLNDPVVLNQWLRAGRFTDLQDRYNELTRPPLAEQITDILDAREAQNGTVHNAAKAAMDEWLREHGALTNVIRPNLGGTEEAKAPSVSNKYAKRIEEIGFANLGDFAHEIWHRNPVQNRMPQVREIMNDFSSVEPAFGGALIPESFDSELRVLELESAIVQPRATVINMNTPTMLFPYVDWSSNASGAGVYGGWTFHMVGEGQTIPTSETKFGRVKLEVNKQVAGAEVPNELMADASSLDGWIRQSLPAGAAYEKDYLFLHGNGAGQPLGVLNSPATITVAKESGQADDTIIVENILKMYSRLLPSSKSRAVWMVNPTTFAQLMTLSIPVGTGGAPIALVNIASAPNPTILGRPVIETEKLPALGNEGDVLLADWSYYLVGLRGGSGLESSPHPQFMNDMTVLRYIQRFDGRPWVQSAFTPRNGETLSPFVALGERDT